MSHRSYKSYQPRVSALEALEARCLLAVDPILSGSPLLISEVSADSHTVLLTRTRGSLSEPFSGALDAPDWIELLNVSDRPVDLAGMHLTDEASAPAKWPFPPGTFIDAGGFLVVFASGEDIRDPALDELGRLHTNFRLGAEGEYLALTGVGGEVVHAFDPRFPPQRTDVSYAVPMESRVIVEANSPIEYLVPEDDSLGLAWTELDFSDPALIGGATSPIGFDRGDAPAEPAETLGGEVIDRELVDFSGGSIVVLETTPFTIAGRVSQWSFYSESTDTITPLVLRTSGSGFEIMGIGRTRTSDGTGAQQFEFDLQSGSDVVRPGRFYFGYKDGDSRSNPPGVVPYSRNDQDADPANDQLGVRRYNGPQSGNLVVGRSLAAGRVEPRTYSVQASTRARLGGVINTDVSAAMTGRSTAYVRYRFDASDLETLRGLLLRIRHEDGFVAYINGTEVARGNVPEEVHYDSTALTNRPLAESNLYDEINISEHRGLLLAGENVLAVQILNDEVANGELALDAQLVGIGMPSAEGFGMASEPTPGGVNGTIYEGFVGQPQPSQGRGFYSEPFSLELTVPEPRPSGSEAAIYYTLNGSHPGPENATAVLYQGPLPISGTTTLRVAAYQEGLLPSLVETHTYLFPEDIVTQATLQPAVTQDPVWGPQMVDSLLALPTISIVTSEMITMEEVETSIEMIFPNGSEGFQVDSGIEEFGGTAASFAKRSMRLSFKKNYGPATLEFDLFDDPGGVTEFDQFILRAGSHDTPFWAGSPEYGPGVYIRNAWANDIQLAQGHPAPRSDFVHVYINGAYSGKYHLRERPNATFMSENFGGDPDDYDALNAGRVVDGDDVAWNALIEAVDNGYEAVQEYLDVVNYADYLLLQWYGGNTVDWRVNSNWMAARRREPGAGFQFFAWDSDIMIRTGATSDIVYFGGPGNLWTINGGIQQYPDFLKLLAERAQVNFFDGGVLTDESLRSQMDAFVEELQLPIIAETARFGSGIYTPESWLNGMQWIKDTYAPLDGPSRAATVIEQMRHAGFFPLTDRPDVLADGQPIGQEQLDPGTELTLTAPLGTIYYTLDGSDPWAEFPSVDYSDLIGAGSPLRYFIPRDGALLTDWVVPGFDDAKWLSGQNSIGYDNDGRLNSLISMDIHDEIFGVNPGAYVRVPFEVDDPSLFETLEFSMRYDDGFVAYLNGVEVARRNSPATPAWNSGASTPRPIEEDKELEGFNLTREMHLLRPGKNVLAIHALNLSADNPDMLISPVLKAGRVLDAGISPSAIVYSGPITVPSGATVKARALWADQWSTLRQAQSEPEIFPLRISEVMYNPPAPSDAERAAGFTDKDDFEFIELVNISDSTLDLTGVRFVQVQVEGQTEGVSFDFSSAAIRELSPGERVLVVEDVGAFAARYGEALPVAGAWSGGLGNAGEQITLVAGETTLHEFRYEDTWHAQSDGGGRSLEILVEASDELAMWGEASGWLASIGWGGTPGLARGSAAVLPGDMNLDGVVDSGDQEALALALSDAAHYAARYGVPASRGGDSDGDGDLDFDDIAGLVALLPASGLSSGRAAAADEPRAASRFRKQESIVDSQSAAWAAEVDIALEPLGRRRWKYGPGQE